MFDIVNVGTTNSASGHRLDIKLSATDAAVLFVFE